MYSTCILAVVLALLSHNDFVTMFSSRTSPVQMTIESAFPHLPALSRRSWEILCLTPSHHQPTRYLEPMSDSPPHRISYHHSFSSPIPLRSALKRRNSSRASQPSPPTSPPLSTPPTVVLGHASHSMPSALPNQLISTGGYTPKVSFDTFENPAASMFSFTLSAESVGYARTPQTRVFLCAASPDESGRQALDWALDSLVQDGDELVVFRGFDEEDLGTSHFCSVRRADVRLPHDTAKDHDVIRDEARELLQQVQAKSVEYDPERKVCNVWLFVYSM